MLILLDDGLGRRAAELRSEEHFVECLENLAWAHRKGLHVLTASAATLRGISNVLAGDTAGTLRQLAQRAQERSMLVALVSDYVLVEDRRDGPVVTRSNDGRIVHAVAYSFFGRVSSAQASTLIAEDSDDCDIYVSVLKAYLQTAGLSRRALQVVIHGFGGGGSSTADQFSDHAILGPTLCVVDSDKTHDSGPLGSTANAVRDRCAELAATAVARVEILPCHELENLLPPRLLADSLVSSDDRTLTARCHYICDRNLTSAAAHVRFLDLKRGLRGYSRVDESDAYRAYVEPVLKSCLLAECRETPSCGDWDSCTCRAFDGLGGGFVKRCAEVLERSSAKKVAEYFFAQANESADTWRGISQILMSWAIAAVPLRT